MFSLMLKDILVQKKTVLFGFFYIFFVIIAFQSFGASTFPTGMVIFSYMLISTSCAYDEKNKSDILVNSLPLKRATIVRAKYFSVLMFFVVGVFYYGILTGIMGVLNLPLKVYPITLEGLVSALAGVAFINGLYFPVFFKIGYVKSRMVSFVLFFAIFFGLTALSDLLKTYMDNTFIQGFFSYFSDKPDAVFITMMMVLVMGLMAVSYGLSAKFYQNRDF